MSLPVLTLLARGGSAGPGFFFPLLILLLIGGIAVWWFRRRGRLTGSGSAMDALQERFARGDIDQAEYEHRKAVLTGADVVPPASGTTQADE